MKVSSSSSSFTFPCPERIRSSECCHVFCKMLCQTWTVQWFIVVSSQRTRIRARLHTWYPSETNVFTKKSFVMKVKNLPIDLTALSGKAPYSKRVGVVHLVPGKHDNDREHDGVHALGVIDVHDVCVNPFATRTALDKERFQNMFVSVILLVEHQTIDHAAVSRQPGARSAFILLYAWRTTFWKTSLLRRRLCRILIWEHRWFSITISCTSALTLSGMAFLGRAKGRRGIRASERRPCHPFIYSPKSSGWMSRNVGNSQRRP